MVLSKCIDKECVKYDKWFGFFFFSSILKFLYYDWILLYCICVEINFLLFEHLGHHSDDWIVWIAWSALYIIRTSNNRCYCTLFLGFFFEKCELDSVRLIYDLWFPPLLIFFHRSFKKFCLTIFECLIFEQSKVFWTRPKYFGPGKIANVWSLAYFLSVGFTIDIT